MELSTSPIEGVEKLCLEYGEKIYQNLSYSLKNHKFIKNVSSTRNFWFWTIGTKAFECMSGRLLPGEQDIKNLATISHHQKFSWRPLGTSSAPSS